MENEKANILYVDDEMNNLTTFKAAFRKFYNVLTADTIAEAVQLLKENEIMVVIVDQRMPEMTGIQFIESIAHEHEYSIKMILTGVNNVQSILEAINTGRLFRYILKPWDFNEVKSAIDSGIHLYQLSKENRFLFEQAKNEVEQHKRITSYLKRFISPQLLNSIILNESIDTSSFVDTRVVSSLYIDYSSFVFHLRKMDNHLAIITLKQILTCLGAFIKEYNGSILSFHNDYACVIFGAPITSNVNFATYAVQYALIIQSKLHSIIDDKIKLFMDMGEISIFNLITDDEARSLMQGNPISMSYLRLLHSIENEGLYVTKRLYNHLSDLILQKQLEAKVIENKNMNEPLYLINQI